MEDRSVQFPNRYRFIKVAGTDDIYELIPAPGEISEEGTFINKGTLLTDETAAKFFESLVGTETVNQVLGILGNYNLYWWQRRIPPEPCVVVGTSTVNGRMFGSGNHTLYASESVSIDTSTNAITLNEPSSLFANYTTSTSSIAAFVRNKYWFVDTTSGSTAHYSISGSVTISGYEGYCNYYPVSVGNTDPEWEYIQSNARNAYPDSGESGGYEYQFLGRPLDNAVTVPKIEIGSYTGTGTGGSENPVTLTFDGRPAMVAIYTTSNGSISFALYGRSTIRADISNELTNSGDYAAITWNDNSISWYDPNANPVLNARDTKYRYIAFLM